MVQQLATPTRIFRDGTKVMQGGWAVESPRYPPAWQRLHRTHPVLIRRDESAARSDLSTYQPDRSTADTSVRGLGGEVGRGTEHRDRPMPMPHRGGLRSRQRYVLSLHARSS